MPNTASAPDHLSDLVRTLDTALLVTQPAVQPRSSAQQQAAVQPQATAQQLYCRPMAVARVTADSKIWFVTSLDAAAVSRIINRPQTCVVMQNRRAWLSLSGTADVVHDRAQIKELWQDAWKVWFPAGRTDPSITLIHFAAHEGEYWDASGFAGRRFQFPTGNPCPAETAPRTQTSRHQQAADYSYRR